MNQTPQQYLRCKSSADTWVDSLPIAEYAYDTQASRVIGQTSLFLSNGFELRTATDLLLPTSTQSRIPQPAKYFALSQACYLKAAQRAIIITQEDMTSSRAHSRLPSYEPGQLVLLSTQNLDSNVHRKFRDNFIGPALSRRQACRALGIPTAPAGTLASSPHVSLLKAYRGSAPSPNTAPTSFSTPTQTPPVAAVNGHRQQAHVDYYFVYFANEMPDDARWILYPALS